MAEQTFKSPGFFEREIEVISRPIFRNTATPAGLIGTAERGPAFVPTTVSSIEEYTRIFGSPDRRMLSGHAATEFFRNNGKALTFCRTLGTGYSDGSGSQNAGFKLRSDQASGQGSVYFLTAHHTLDNAEHLALGLFNDNDSHTTAMDKDLTDNNGVPEAASDGKVALVRAMLFAHKDVVIQVTLNGANDYDTSSSSEFTIYINSSDNSDDYSRKVSLDPSASNYISKVLNTDPLAFDEHKVLLYAHFPVDDEVASVGNNKVAILRGKDADFLEKYANFESKFTAPETPSFISQPFGDKEYDLFHFESLDDGAFANSKYKISISNLRASTDPTDEFGTFTVSVRDLKDTDEAQIIYETFTNCSLNPNSVSFIGNVIGDQKLYYDFEAPESERRLIREGSFANKSTRIRVVVSDDVLSGEAPATALPFGFRGVPALLLNSDGTDDPTTTWLTGASVEANTVEHGTNLLESVLPPLPCRFKVTKGSIKTGSSYAHTFTGEASASESVDFNLHWGLLSTRVKDINNPNYSTEFNHLLSNYTKFLGADSTVVSKSKADSHNNNKFSLAKVAFKTPIVNNVATVSIAELKGTASDLFKDAVYLRNADVGTDLYDSATHTIKFSESTDDLTEENTGDDQAIRMSLAKLLAEDPVKFNKYNVCAKFTAPFFGGFDGLNILDSDSYYMTDKAASIEEGTAAADTGKASSDGFLSGVHKTALSETTDGNTQSELVQGVEEKNNVVASYLNAINLMTDEMVVNHNILVLPGVRDPFVTDQVKIKCEEFGKALYLMDIQQFDADGLRVFVNEKGISSSRPDVDETSSAFDRREVNSSYTASYFPDIKILDFSDEDEAATESRRMIKVPPSIVALGALAKTDDVAQPWFAPAGFTRGSLETIQAIDVRLNSADRDTLYEARINPIANFPNKQFVIFGQKTSQLARTALDRVNVRRLVLEVKRRIELIAQGLLFEQNNSKTRERFIQSSASQLASIQVNQGIEDFRVVMDETNNSAEDVDNNRLNGKIIIVPTRAVEFIAIDFVITNAGVEFP